MTRTQVVVLAVLVASLCWLAGFWRFGISWEWQIPTVGFIVLVVMTILCFAMSDIEREALITPVASWILTVLLVSGSSGLICITHFFWLRSSANIHVLHRNGQIIRAYQQETFMAPLSPGEQLSEFQSTQAFSSFQSDCKASYRYKMELRADVEQINDGAFRKDYEAVEKTVFETFEKHDVVREGLSSELYPTPTIAGQYFLAVRPRWEVSCGSPSN
jgi:hypothetical protein